MNGKPSKCSRCVLGAVLVLGVAFSPGRALAEEAVAPRDQNWSIGIGIGSAMIGRLLPIVDAVISNSGAPSPLQDAGTPLGISLERRLGQRLWLGLRADVGSLTLTENPPDQITTLPGDTFSRTIREEVDKVMAWGLALSTRYVLNPGATVEFSPLLALGVSGQKVTSTTTTEVSSEAPGFKNTKTVNESWTTSFGPSAGLGFAVEAFLGRQVSLRFSTLLASLSYLYAERDYKTTVTPPPDPPVPPPSPPSNIPEQETKRTYGDLRWGITLTPMLEVRVAF